MDATNSEDQGSLTSDKCCQTETLQDCSCQTTETPQEPCGKNPGRNSLSTLTSTWNQNWPCFLFKYTFLPSLLSASWSKVEKNVPFWLRLKIALIYGCILVCNAHFPISNQSQMVQINYSLHFFII